MRQPVEDRTLFALVTLVAGTAAYLVFLRMLSYLTQPWYYIVLLAFAAVCLEMLLAANVRPGVRALFLVAFAALAFLPALKSLGERQTNIDLVAQRLEAMAAADDLILVNPFPYAISLQYYYHGRARVRTIPPIDDLRSHRADLLKTQLMAQTPLAPIFAQIQETLQGGHTVWLVGGVNFVPPNQSPLWAPPAGEHPDAKSVAPIYRAWSEQTAFVLQQRAATFERVPVPLAQPVIHYENVALSAFRGWK